ncbi:MAG TPA: (d)CMP kinase, partial [Myxococcota bacterium]|nr:(d)CMP kinase [Myxococcota bacterium]
EERARRRHEELLTRGDTADYNDVLRDLRDRDNQDRGRQVAPLRAADDAVHLDSTSLAVDEVIRTIVEAVRRLESSADASDDET